jgi:uncharacterized protein YjiS (DUF1127 family)
MTIFETHLPTALIKTRGSFRPLEWAIVAVQSLTGAVITLQDWQERARQRRQLLGLSDAALKDFGVSRADAAGEGDKPFSRP